jgi:hypothetical protein
VGEFENSSRAKQVVLEVVGVLRMRFFKLSVLILSLIATVAPHTEALAASSPPKSKATIRPGSNVWNITGTDGRTISCALFKGKNIVVRRRGSSFTDVALRLKELRSLLARSRAYSARAVKAAKSEQKDLAAIARAGRNCSLGRPAPTPPPVPAEFSMERYSGPMNYETARYLLEKAAYGVSSNEQPVIDLVLAQNLPGAVEELMRVKDEDPTLAARIEDRKNASGGVGGGTGLGDLTTQSRDSFSFRGFRQAALDRAVNTRNPMRENLRQFLLGLWTVGHDVLTSNPTGNPQRVLWWDYFELLGDIAYDRPLPTALLQEFPGKPKLPTRLVQLGRSPMMLLWLSNNQNVAGNPNENYARELMELFSLGTIRVDPATNQSIENYVEFRQGGNRTLGDVYRAARVLTGWRVSPFQDGAGIMQWRSVYSSADHDTDILPMFEGEPHAFQASNDSDLVYGIFERHPAAPLFISKEILRWYVTSEPPTQLIKSFADVLRNTNYDLETSLRVLFNSQAFFHPSYKNTINKNAFQVGVELARTLELSRRGISAPAMTNQEVGINVRDREGTPDNEFQTAYTQGSVASMGYTTSLPLDGVFFFPDQMWTRPATLMETANLATAYLMSTTELARLTDQNALGWLPQRVLPEGRKTSDEVIQFVADRMGVSLTVDALAQYRQFMEFDYSPGRMVNGAPAEFLPFSYDNRLNGIASATNGFVTTNHQWTKARWLYVMMAIHPQFLLK